jgi:hypothetical protein
MDDTVSSIIQPLVEYCSPLKIKVTGRCIEDRYYIDFDGTDTFKDMEDWVRHWISFESYIIHVLRRHNLDYSHVKVTGPATVEAFIGTLFEFLIRERKAE